MSEEKKIKVTERKGDGYASMYVQGTYEGPVTKKDIEDHLNFCFGGTWYHFGNGTFSCKVNTD